MSQIIIYGASDDLIGVEGDINEEFAPKSDDEPTYLAVCDGTVLRISYDGTWKISRVQTGAAEYIHEPASSEDGDREDGKPAYSDIVTLDLENPEFFEWLVVGDRYEICKVPF